jgi:hypothetical protein
LRAALCSTAVRLQVQLLVLAAAFAAATGIAELAGAANLGTAMTFGQMAFAVALTAILARG